MAWIESHQALRTHPKTDLLAELLGASVPQVIGHLHCLWWWALDYAQDGSLARFTDGQVARGCMWDSDASAFVAALINAGFVNDDRTIHDWPDYAGRLIEQRAANAERMRQKRAANVHRTSRARATHVHGLPDRTNSTNQTNRTDRTDSSAAVRPAPDPRVKAVIDHFDARHREHFGKPAVISGAKDGKLIRGLAPEYDADTLRGLVDKFFESDDEWIRNAGATIGVFVACIPKLVKPRVNSPPRGGFDPHWALKQAGLMDNPREPRVIDVTERTAIHDASG